MISFNKNKLTSQVLLAISALAAGAQSAYADVAPLSVKGNHVVVGGEEKSLAGNSLFWSSDGWGGEKFYTDDVVTHLAQGWGTDIIRAAMGVEHSGGYLAQPESNKNKVKTVIEAAIEHDIYVIVDWHTHHAHENTQAAVEFFKEIATTYGEHDNVIYEIYNEPLQVSWSDEVKPYAERVISEIRAIDPDNLIVVGTPTFGQNVDEASLDPIEGDNIAYSLHFSAGSHGEPLRQKAKTALDNGIALFVTEWVSVNADANGPVDYDNSNEWMTFLKANNISHVNWAVNDKAEGSSIFKAGVGDDWTQLSESGEYVKALISQWETLALPIKPILEPTVPVVLIPIPPIEQNVRALSVKDGNVVANDNKVSFAGNSLFFSNTKWGGEKFYTEETINTLKQDWSSNIVRASIGVEHPGGLFDDEEGNKERLYTVIDAAIKNKMYVIVDFHSHAAHLHQDEAIAFFEEVAGKYGHLDNVIYEIYNEPLAVSWNDTVKPYAEDVIDAIRNIDPDNLIIVGTPKWSQNVDEASLAPIEADNIAYSLHFSAGTHGEGLRQKARVALDNGIALFVTEWISVNADGDGAVAYGETNEWMRFLKRNFISHVNWSINDKREAASSFIEGGGWDDLTDSGKLVKDITQNWNRGFLPSNPLCQPRTMPSIMMFEYYCDGRVDNVHGASEEHNEDAYSQFKQGDWVNYYMDVAETGEYHFNFKLKKGDQDATVEVREMDRVTALGTVKTHGNAIALSSKPAISQRDTEEGWVIATTAETVHLKAGFQFLQVQVTEGSADLDWMKISKVGTDSDKDGIDDVLDNCFRHANTAQLDYDADGKGDVCDSDWDNDGCYNNQEVRNGSDPHDANSNVCLTLETNDIDGDGVIDELDNCPDIANLNQWDNDNDGIGNKCDSDANGNGIPDAQDTVICADTIHGEECPGWPLPEAPDKDGDGVAFFVDNCPDVANPGQWDKDKDGIGNACDDDIDGDGCPNEIELALGTKVWQKDSTPMPCLLEDDIKDSDNDGVFDYLDNCPSIANKGQWDKDKDGLGNVCDDDIDGDGCANDIEIALGTKAWQSNSTPKTCEMPIDTDADGIFDSLDNCPRVANKGQWDRDKDGIGNECDHDVDGDGYSNALERFLEGHWFIHMWRNTSPAVVFPKCETLECDQQAESIGTNYDKWQALGVQDYTFTYESFPYNCPAADALPPVNITVENGLVVKAESPELGIVYENLALEPWPTIEDLYSALAAHARIVDTGIKSFDFSSPLGLLSQFEVEESAEQCDGGKSIRISNFKPIEEEGVICSTYVQTSFDLQFKLDNLEGTTHCDGQVVVQNEQGQSFFLDSGYAKTEDGVTTCSYYGVDEMPGTYSLSAKFAGFDALVVEDIVVGSNVCHVEPHQETYTLQASEQACHDGYDLVDGKCLSISGCLFPLYDQINVPGIEMVDESGQLVTFPAAVSCVEKCEYIEGDEYLPMVQWNSCPSIIYP